MVFLIPQDVNPIRLAYLGLKYSGAMNLEGRPWSLLLASSHVVLINFFGISAVIELFCGSGKLTDLVQTMSAIFVYTHVNSKNINLLMHEKEIRQILTRLESIRRAVSEDHTCKQFVLHAENSAKTFIIVLNAMFFGFPIFSFINNFITDYFTDFQTPHLAHQIWVPWSMNELGPYLGGTTLITVLTLSTVIYYSAYGTLQLAFTFEMSAFIKILQHRLETSGPKDTSVIPLHQAIIQLIKSYNHLFAGQIYLEILVSSLQPCGFGYAFLKVLKTYDPGASDLPYKFLICVFAPFFTCSCGQELSTQMEKIHEYSYMSNWYEENSVIKKDLLQLMTATVKPIELNYRNAISFNYLVYARVVQGIYTYLTMMINLDTN